MDATKVTSNINVGAVVTKKEPLYPLIEFPEGDLNDFYFQYQCGMLLAHVCPPRVTR